MALGEPIIKGGGVLKLGTWFLKFACAKFNRMSQNLKETVRSNQVFIKQVPPKKGSCSKNLKTGPFRKTGFYKVSQGFRRF